MTVERRKRRRKDRVLNTRISEELDAQLRKTAEEMDVSVSQLVRRALHRTVDMVGNLSGNVEHLVQEAIADVQSITKVGQVDLSDRDLRASPALAQVVGWQEIKTQRRTRCQLTGGIIEQGDTAYASVKSDNSAPLIISEETFEIITTPPSEQWSQMMISKATVCGDTQEEMKPGDRAWIRIGSQPPEIISQDAYLRRRSASDKHSTGPSDAEL